MLCFKGITFVSGLGVLLIWKPEKAETKKKKKKLF